MEALSLAPPASDNQPFSEGEGVEDKQDGGVGFLNPMIGGLEARMRSRRGSMETLREKSLAMDSGCDISGAFSGNMLLASSDDGGRSRELVTRVPRC
ncbi:hypothetical protein DY000_02056925 [Brassica cretica]|uniref:Uncharacterized protein n=1 Tax=Brassica cretica TaxID=69181 RepID=A0ABQ7AC70_BRACR|nr:hypothetical protein DY000_02056925 [Brassica cretica]